MESRDYSMLYAQQIDNSLDWKATQLRIVFGEEPEHFLRIFKGEMMILMVSLKQRSYIKCVLVSWFLELLHVIALVLSKSFFPKTNYT